MALIPKSINPDLIKERNGASFDVNEFAAWFHGGAEKLQMKRKIENEILGDMEDTFDDEYLSYVDNFNVGVKRALNAITKMKNLQNKYNPGGNDIFPTLMGGETARALVPSGTPVYVHFLMFTRALQVQSTPEMYEKFGRRAENYEIIGSYAQTELGHGTFIRGIETRADYDRETEEFVLNTPKLTSYKWWPGGLGQLANYCIVVAQLYIDNEHKGLELFVLQVRDEDTHMPLAGIDIGDIGKKIGMQTVNNGYLGLKNVRIPRTNMLMKNSQVLADGTFVESRLRQLNYLPMVFVRCTVAMENSGVLLQAATISTRYSAVRRQSPINPDDPEPQILDHVTQQLKIFPEIATGIAHRLAADHLKKLYDKTANAIEEHNFALLPELHALACTLKATCSYDSAFGIERLRLACGGHGYLAAANLGNILLSAAAACTYEGENSVLYLQVGRMLLRSWGNVLAGKQLMPTMAYQEKWAAHAKFPKWTGTLENLVHALQYATTNKIRVAFQSYKNRLDRGQTQPEAFNNTGIELTQAAELHGRVFVANTFLLEVTSKAKAAKRSPQLNRVLENLLELYLAHTMLRHLNDILRFIELTDAQVTALQTRLENALHKIRPDAVAICDGFDYHDRILNSVLGSYDGNVYERIFESAKKSPLNQQSVPKSFHQHLKPFTMSKI